MLVKQIYLFEPTELMVGVSVLPYQFDTLF